MKTARLIPATVAVICPDCGGDIPEPHFGTLVWEIIQIATGEVVCPDCGTRSKLKLPKTLKT